MILLEPKTDQQGVRSLAEAVILQSLIDLHDRRYCRSCRRFFSGEVFTLWAHLAELGPLDQIRVLHLIQNEMQRHN